MYEGKKRDFWDFLGAVAWYAMRHWPLTCSIVAGLVSANVFAGALERAGLENLAFLPLLFLAICVIAGIWVDRNIVKEKAKADPDAAFIREFLRVSPPAHAGKKKQKTLEDVWREIDSLVGLTPVKQALREITALVLADRERRKQGKKPIHQTLHMMFLGNPGTGKTTIARLVGELFAALGVLPSGHMVESDRSGLVAGYVGQTALKTQEKINQAMGGILFIDEAYSLASVNAGWDFGREALDTLIKAMEDYRDKFCVILVGYTSKMDDLLKLNPGLESRIAFTIDFPDYSPPELVEIAEQYARKRDWALGDGVEEKLLEIFEREHFRIGELGNGRYARNIIEQAERKAAMRIARGQGPADTLLVEDFGE